MSIRKIQLPNNSTIDINDERIHIYRSLTGVAGGVNESSLWNVTDSNVSAYKDGMVVCLKVPVAGSSYGVGFQINELGSKPIVYNVNTSIGTRYSVGSVVWAVYNATQTAPLYLEGSLTTITGVWQVMDYDKNTTSVSTLLFNSGTRVVTGHTLGRYNLSFAKSPNLIIPWHDLGSSTSTAKTMTTEEFDPFLGVYYYAAATAIAAGNTVSNSEFYWKYTAVNLRYSLNVSTTTLEASKELYVVISLQSNGYFKFASPYYSQTLPTTNDGKYYMLLGYTYSKYQMELYPFHPIYYHNGTKLCVYGGTQSSGGSNVALSNLLSTGTRVATMTIDGTSSDILVPSGSEPEAITEQEINALLEDEYILTGTGTQEDPIVGWYENVACVVNPTGTSASGTYTATIEGVYDFLSNILGQGEPTSYYFSYNDSVIDIVIYKKDSKISSQTMMGRQLSLPILNALSVMSSYFTVDSSDLVTFNLIED